MQDTNQNQNQNQNRQQGQGQQGMGSDSNWSNNQGMSGDNNDGTEVDTPQQPRHVDEPIVGGGQNWGTNDSPTSGARSQMNRDQAGGTSAMGDDLQDEGSFNSQRMGNDIGNRSGDSGMGGQSNQGEGMRGGSMGDQGTMSDQRGKSGGTGAQGSGSDDYMRNEIGSSTSGSAGSNRSSDM